MTTLAPRAEQWQHVASDIESSCGRSGLADAGEWARVLGRLSIGARDRYLGIQEYERSPVRTDTPTASTSDRSGRGWGPCNFVWPGPVSRRFCRSLQRLERRAAEVLLLIREAFLRGLSTRAVGRVVALLTEEPGSAQTVSRLTRDLDRPRRSFIRWMA